MPDLDKSWESWSNYVILTLEKLEKRLDDLEVQTVKDAKETAIELTSIKTKAAILGALISVGVSIVVGILVYKFTEGDKPSKNGLMNVPSNYMLAMTPPTREEVFEKWEARKRSC